MSCNVSVGPRRLKASELNSEVIPADELQTLLGSHLKPGQGLVISIYLYIYIYVYIYTVYIYIYIFWDPHSSARTTHAGYIYIYADMSISISKRPWSMYFLVSTGHGQILNTRNPSCHQKLWLWLICQVLLGGYIATAPCGKVLVFASTL